MFTPMKRAQSSAINEMAYLTPYSTPLSFSKELRQVLQERNLLTAKSRKKVCSMLDGSPLNNSPNPEVDKRKNFRLQAIQEIVNTEKNYLHQLEMLMHFFVRPLKERAIIDIASHTALFGQIEMIYNLNGELLRELTANMENVAQAILKMAPFFKLYSVYAFDYRNALLILQDLTSKNPVFYKFLQATESRPEVQRKLNSLMIVPIQRLPRYKLLLEQVLLYTSPADTDFKLLKESIKQIESTVSHINACIEDQEVTQLLIHLQNSLVSRMPNIVKPSRKVIKEGVLQKITRTGSEIKRYCVLMSDIFMYCKILKERKPNTVVDNSLECCCIFPLKKCKVYELFPGNFKLTCQGDGIIFGTTDLQLGRTWVRFIRDAIDLHIQCRKTLRKDSSKRTPIRKKNLKNFGSEYVLSPNKKKCEYDTIFRNKNYSSESEEEPYEDATSSSCFQRKRAVPPSTNVQLKMMKGLKRPAAPPPPPPPPPAIEIDNSNLADDNEQAKSISKLYQLIAKDNRGILKRAPATTTTHEHDPTYGFATFSNTNNKPDSSKEEDLNDGAVNMRDVLYPLRLSGGSNKSANGGSSGWSLPGKNMLRKRSEVLVSPPLKKRVKFDENSAAICAVGGVGSNQQPFSFSRQIAATTASRTTLRERIYDFFANLF